MKELIEKIKVKSAEIVVNGTADKPYYEIKYYDVSDGKYHIGYSSYDIHNVFQWLEDCFDIIQEETIAYNDCWIPCSERLPKEHKLYDITTKNDTGIHSDSAIFNPYIQRWLWDADETELVEIEVLAWAEKRKPYQLKGE